MNNQPKIEAYKSFYRQAKDFYAAGDVQSARDSFLRAAELANEIATSSSSYDVRREYYRLGTRILDFVRANCSGKPVAAETEGEKETEVCPVQTSGVTFDDVAGLQEVKEQVRFHVLEPLKNPELASSYGIKAGGRILLYGPPGTGKTFIARAIAGEVNAVFYAVNCQDLISKYMGDSSKELDALFETAQKNERAIIFFDEFDSVASKRDGGEGNADAEMARFVATFLTKVDGFKKSDTCKMLLLIAATNRPWAIDSAMLRGGRFDTQIYVGLPDRQAREFLVNRAMKDIPAEPDVSLTKLAAALEGFGGGDIVAICDKIRLEAYKKAVLNGKKHRITREDCNNVLRHAVNPISGEELARFEKYRSGKLPD